MKSFINRADLIDWLLLSAVGVAALACLAS
jgi:hypothetical protein